MRLIYLFNILRVECFKHDFAFIFLKTTLKKNSLASKWDAYKQTLAEAEEMLKKNRDKFKTKLLQQSEEFKKNVSELVNDFKTKGPFTSDIKPDDVRSWNF